jgi:hypothetical protein
LIIICSHRFLRIAQCNEDIPDTNALLPRKDVVPKLKEAFISRGSFLEQEILKCTKEERSYNFDNFNNGSGFEDTFCEVLSELLPKRCKFRLLTF